MIPKRCSSRQGRRGIQCPREGFKRRRRHSRRLTMAFIPVLSKATRRSVRGKRRLDAAVGRCWVMPWLRIVRAATLRVPARRSQGVRGPLLLRPGMADSDNTASGDGCSLSRAACIAQQCPSEVAWVLGAGLAAARRSDCVGFRWCRQRHAFLVRTGILR